MHDFISFTLEGITSGMIYSALALSLVLIWRATRVVNFAQGGMAMITTFIAITLIDRHISYWVAFVVALASGLIIGALVEAVLIRPLANKPEINAVIVTLGFLIVLEALAGLIWGGGYRSFPAPFSLTGFKLGHGASRIAFSPFSLFTITAVVAVALLLVALFRYTSVGLKMRAAAFGPEVARLLGVRVGRILTLGWALAAVVGSLAGLLVSPSIFLYPNSTDTVLIYGFTAAILGGLDSPVGAIVGGLGIGMAVTYVGGYAKADLETLAALVILVVVLMIRPEGIFTSSAPRKV